jgi:secreted Zn-dependent insulinase-like peptidase
MAATEERPASPSSPLLPKHDKLVQGTLENGLSYIILPNKVPAGRFEAHLEVLSGSAHELASQQGMAHLLEHVVYMGSPKRQLISGTGSRTNAYTDFHHTVFFAACPTETPDQFWKKSMLPMAFDALVDVMTTNVNDERMEKERAAVLSEASMVNKMEYRVECQVLSALHSENRISKRFPIGKENLIKKWRKEDVQQYHSMHYRPDNVILYVVGDVDVGTTVQTIKQKFGGLRSKLDATGLMRASGEFSDSTVSSLNRHFPPVAHSWSCDTTDEKVGLSVFLGSIISSLFLAFIGALIFLLCRLLVFLYSILAFFPLLSPFLPPSIQLKSIHPSIYPSTNLSTNLPIYQSTNM